VPNSTIATCNPASLAKRLIEHHQAKLRSIWCCPVRDCYNDGRDQSTH